MIEQQTYKSMHRKLATARGRFQRAAAAYRQLPPNLYSHEVDKAAALVVVDDARNAAYFLLDVGRNAMGTFDSVGYPDSWREWEAAAEDADRFLSQTDHLVEWKETVA